MDPNQVPQKQSQTENSQVKQVDVKNQPPPNQQIADQTPQSEQQPPQPLEKKHSLSTHSKSLDAFGFISMFISLYFVSAAIGMMLHFYAEKYFPIIGNEASDGSSIGDVFSYFLIDEFSSSYGTISPLVPYIATLIVVYPMFAILFLVMNKRTLDDSSIRELKSRKFFLYFTLVVTFIFMLYKVISLVINLLTGNGNLNFMSHFLITIGINSSIFAYCLNQLWEDKKINA